jgi:hypothetical protein
MLTKLTSRKFWCSIIAFFTSLLTAFGVADSTVAQVALILGGIAALVVYICCETAIDKVKCIDSNTPHGRGS